MSKPFYGGNMRKMIQISCLLNLPRAWGRLRCLCICNKYSKTEKRQNKDLNDTWELNEGQKYCRMLPLWSILQYFWPALSDNWSWKPIFRSFWNERFTLSQVLLYQNLMWWYPIYWTTQGEEQEGDSGPSDEEDGELDKSVENDEPDAENTDRNSEVCTVSSIRYKRSCAPIADSDQPVHLAQSDQHLWWTLYG